MVHTFRVDNSVKFIVRVVSTKYTLRYIHRTQNIYTVHNTYTGHRYTYNRIPNRCLSFFQ